MMGNCSMCERGSCFGCTGGGCLCLHSMPRLDGRIYREREMSWGERNNLEAALKNALLERDMWRERFGYEQAQNKHLAAELDKLKRQGLDGSSNATGVALKADMTVPPEPLVKELLADGVPQSILDEVVKRLVAQGAFHTVTGWEVHMRREVVALMTGVA